MIVLVCGSRDWEDRSLIRWRLIIHADYARARGDQLSVIHGAARGADQIAAEICRAYGIPEQAFPADWRGKGKRAGILRNLQMLDQAPDLVIAFQRNNSRGTQHTIDEAARRGIPTEVHRLPHPPLETE